MSILTHFVNTSGHLFKKQSFSFKALVRMFQKCSEVFWLATSFILFLLMGPFSVIAVVPALCSLGSEKFRNNMREPQKA